MINEEKKVILIVDDDPTNRAVLSFPLKSRPDLEIIEASDGLEALGILDTQKVDLILLDIHMPRMNGIEFLKIRLERPDLREIPVIMVSTDDEQKKEAESYGANGYLVKPISPLKIYELISSYLV